MLGSVLKQLVVGLGRFVGFHAGRVLHPNEPKVPAAGEPAGGFSPAKQAIDALNDQVGLDAQYLRPWQWPAYREDVVSEELSSDPLYQLWTETSGGHKWTQYFAAYREVFGPLTSKPMRILEIGVLNGAGLRLWRKYFAHPDTLVVGIDIQPACARFDSPDEGIRVRIGSQADPVFLQEIIREFGPFDLILS